MSEQNKFDSTYSAVLSIANNLIEQGKYDSTYSAVLSIYQNLTGDTTTSFDSVYSIVVNIAEGIESGEIDLGGGSDIELVPLNETVTYNGLHQFVPVDGVAYNQVDITVDVYQSQEEPSRTEWIYENGTYEYIPQKGYDGMQRIEVNVDVPTGGGGSGSEEQDFSPKIRFFDFDGNIVEQWTLDEAKTKTVDDLPVLKEIWRGDLLLLPDGWNTPIEDMWETTSDIAVGSMWKPSDGNSWIKVNIGPENLTTVLFMEVLGDSVIDWGDGTTDDAGTISGYPPHTYDSAGEKWIKIIGDWNPKWGVGSDLTAVYNNYSGWYYHNQITEIYLGRDTKHYSFGYLKSLQYITFPNIQHTYNNFGLYCSFAQDGSLKNLYLPYGDGNMPTASQTSGPFYRCYDLEVISWRGWHYTEYSGSRYHAHLGQFLFNKLYNLRYTTIHHTVNYIGQYAFQNCRSLQSITIPDQVHQIFSSVFTYCTSLQSVIIPDSVVAIDGSIFSGCYSLQSVNIPNRVTSIEPSEFGSCYSLQSINIPNSVTSISNSAFAYCYSLQSITIPDSVTSIITQAFSGCKSLQSITIPDSVTSLGNSAFDDCESLQSVTIGNGVTSIGNLVFSDCESLQSVTIGNGVTSIGSYAFYNCYSLQSITIPDSVTSIGSQVFYNVSYLTVDFSQNTQVPTLSSTNAFDSNCLILVPESLYDEWISATNWSSMASRIIAV